MACRSILIKRFYRCDLSTWTKGWLTASFFVFPQFIMYISTQCYILYMLPIIHITMTTPAIILTVLLAINLLLAAHDHGKPKTGTFNFWYSFIWVLIVIPLLVWGGFYN